jgi:uncharacterized protein Smg (DUF494 family)
MKTEHVNASAIGTGRVMEIVLFLVGEMRRNKQIGDIDLGKLSERGFSESEVSTAFSWLLDKIALDSKQSNVTDLSKFTFPGKTPFRVYHDFELAFLTKEARGYLMQISELGLLGGTEMELLIDRLWFAGANDIDVEVVRDLAAAIIFDFSDASNMGSRMMLSMTDRVQ